MHLSITVLAKYHKHKKPSIKLDNNFSFLFWQEQIKIWEVFVMAKALCESMQKENACSTVKHCVVARR